MHTHCPPDALSAPVTSRAHALCHRRRGEPQERDVRAEPPRRRGGGGGGGGPAQLLFTLLLFSCSALV
ncbi:hypothetical protein MHYP_G00208600 [Metynnis hypsauchen]